MYANKRWHEPIDKISFDIEDPILITKQELDDINHVYKFEYIPKNDDVNFDIYDEIKIWLKKNKIRSGELSGVLIDVKENINELAMLMEGAFRGVSCLNFLLPQSNVLIVPDHHFSLTFYTKQIEGEKKCIKSILEKHTLLRYFEEN